MCLLASMHIKCQCQRRVHAYRLLASMLVQMFSACMLTTYSAEMLFFRRAAAVSPPHKSLCGARLVCVLCTCGARLWFCNVHFLHIVHFVHIVHILHIVHNPPSDLIDHRLYTTCSPSFPHPSFQTYNWASFMTHLLDLRNPNLVIRDNKYEQMWCHSSSLLFVRAAKTGLLLKSLTNTSKGIRSCWVKPWC